MVDRLLTVVFSAVFDLACLFFALRGGERAGRFRMLTLSILSSTIMSSPRRRSFVRAGLRVGWTW